jgi:hypothetical protein
LHECIGCRCGGQVVAQQPKLSGNRLIPGEDHDSTAGDADHLGHTMGKVAPVMHGQHRERGVDGARSER